MSRPPRGTLVSRLPTAGLLSLCGLGALAVVSVNGFTTRVLLACLLAVGMMAVGAVARWSRGSMEADVPRFSRRPVATEGFVEEAWEYLRRRAVGPAAYLVALAVVWTLGGLAVVFGRLPPIESLLGLALASGLAAALQWRRLDGERILRGRLRRLKSRPLDERLRALPELVRALPRDVTAALIGYRVEREFGLEDE